MDQNMDELSVVELCALGVKTIAPNPIAFYPLTKQEGEEIRKHMTENYPDVKFNVSYILVYSGRTNRI